MNIEGALRTRALYVLATFGGVCAGLATTFMLLGRLAVPTVYGVFGVITGAPVGAVLWRELGPRRAVMLAVATAVGAGLLMFALGQGACALASCSR